MSEEKAKKIYKAYCNGVRVMIVSHYVDGFARLWLDGETVMISSQVWADEKLTEIEFRLQFYKQLDLEDLEATANHA